MERRIINRTCYFCGKTREVVIAPSGTPDESGRSYGIHEIDYDEGCNCLLGQALFKQFKMKKMCKNCAYYKNNRCTNKKTKDEMSAQFEILELKIKDNTKKCQNWEVSQEIINFFV